ncbi:MAG: hypothetical protein ACI9WS_003322 [Paraglaciecola psychrophila]|jgi:hypothetical protein
MLVQLTISVMFSDKQWLGDGVKKALGTSTQNAATIEDCHHCADTGFESRVRKLCLKAMPEN